MDEQIGILAFEQMRSKFNMGSSRIRAINLVKYLPQSELFVMGRMYSVVIFQKAYWIDYAERFSGIKILDICDPDFLDWRSPCLAMAHRCDAITTSTPRLADIIARYVKRPTWCIPDRLDLETFADMQKVHLSNGRAETAAWFGYSSNIISLENALPDLVQCGFKRVIVISELGQEYVLPRQFASAIALTPYPYHPDTINSYLLEADVVLNYKLAYGRWQYKSNNKTITAWALGLPVAHSTGELLKWLPEAARISESMVRLHEVRDRYDIRLSAREVEAVIRSVRTDRSACFTEP